MNPASVDLGGRVIAITGSAGQLGQQYTAAVRSAGGRVLALDFREQAGRDPDVLCVRADVTRRADLEDALAVCRERFGQPPAGLVNNAAIDAPPDAPISENGPFETYPQESLERILSVNVTGVVLCTQVMGQAMAEQGRGSIVNISSTYGLVSPDQRLYEFRRRQGQEFFKPVGYSVSKSALLNLTRYAATYWGARGVRVNTLTLGGVYNNQDPEFVAAYSSRVPLGRMARPDEYNGAILFLLSDLSSYMTGANLVVDGGWTAW
jgi:NAD(P)-dependent dehydrogenase (short-subunit alcohol dehydrogenase family)